VGEDAAGNGLFLDIFGAGLAGCAGCLTVGNDDMGWLRPGNGVTRCVTRCHKI
jgi:hypothetical protein